MTIVERKGDAATAQKLRETIRSDRETLLAEMRVGLRVDAADQARQDSQWQ